MITIYRSNTRYVIPDGEGFNALPIAFNLDNVIASQSREAISQEMRTLSRLRRTLALRLQPHTSVGDERSSQ